MNDEQIRGNHHFGLWNKFLLEEIETSRIKYPKKQKKYHSKNLSVCV